MAPCPRSRSFIWSALLLALLVPLPGRGVVPGETPPVEPGQPPAPADPPGATTASATVTVDKPEVQRGELLGFRRETGFLANERLHVFLGSKKVGTTSSRSADGKEVYYLVPDCRGVCREGGEDCEKTCATCDETGGGTESCANCRTFVALGRHSLRVEINGVPVPLSTNRIRIVKDSDGTPEITAIYPTTSYPDPDSEETSPKYSLTVHGKGFSSHGCDNELHLGGSKVGNVCWDGDTACRDNSDFIQARAISSRELEFKNLKRDPEVPPQLAIGVLGEGSKAHPVALAQVSRDYPLRAAGGVLAGLAVLTFLVGARLRQSRTNEIAGQRYGLFTALLLDKETDTYSLSRFQFYIWTAIAIFGYVYLATSKSMIQGKLDFIDVPEGLPGIVFISAATNLIAQWTQSTRGPKGAGDVQPSWSDFISTGGVVAPERFQFFVWTVLGAVAFVTLVLLREPGIIQDLPRVPEGFLALMGISSAGYLGGKMVRRPGPVIDEIRARLGSLQFTIRGRNLHRDATFRIGDITLPMSVKPDPKTADDLSNEPGMFKELELRITDENLVSAVRNATEKLQLTVINPDAQKAVWPFTLEIALEKDQAVSVQAGAKAPATISGTGFSQGAKARLEIEGLGDIPSPVVTVQSVTDTAITVEIDATKTTTVAKDLTGKLVIENPDTGKVHVPLTIEAAEGVPAR